VSTSRDERLAERLARIRAGLAEKRLRLGHLCHPGGVSVS